jgi:hypothetical protein
LAASISPSISPSPSPGWVNYTRGDEVSLPSNDNDLETIYSAQDVIDVATSNDVRVNQSATSQYAIHQYKMYADVLEAKNECFVTWEGQSDSTATIYLQIYNQVSGLWETIGQSPADYDGSITSYDKETVFYDGHSINTDFNIRASVPDLTNYKKYNVVSFRIYQREV